MIKGDGTNQLHGYSLRKGGTYIRCILQAIKEVQMDEGTPIKRGTIVKGYMDWEEYRTTNANPLGNLCFYVQHPYRPDYFEWCFFNDFKVMSREIMEEDIKEGIILKAFGLSNDRYIINKIEDGLEVRGMENNILFTDDDNIEKLCDKLNEGLIAPYRPYGFTVEKYGENKPVENPKNKYTLMEILVDGEDGDQYKSRGGDISIYKTGEGIVIKSPWKNVNISANETFTLVDKKKPVTLYGVRHKPNGKIYDFVLKDDVMPPCKGDIVVVEDSQGVHYVKVDRIKEVHLSSGELEKYKFIIANL